MTNSDADSNDILGISPVIKLWEILWRRWLILIIGGVVGVALALTYWLVWPRTFESSAKILVMRKDPTIAASGVSRGAETEAPQVSAELLATHVELLRSRKIVSEALQAHGLDKLPSILKEIQSTPAKTPADYVIDHLKVTSGGEGAAAEAHVLNVPFRHNNAKDAKHVVEAIVERYQQFLDEKFVDINTEAAKLITQAQGDLAMELKRDEERYFKFRETAPLLWSSQQGVTNTHRVQYEKIQQELSDLELEISESQSRLELAEKTLKKLDQDGGSGLARLALIDAKNAERINLFVNVEQGEPQSAQFQAMQPERTAGAQTEHQDLLELLANEKTLLQNFGPSHPEVVKIRNRIAAIREFLGSKSKLLEVSHQELLDPKKLIDAYVDLLRYDLTSAQQRQAQLRTFATREEDATKLVVKYELQESELKSKLDRTQQLYNAVVERLRDINLAKQYSGFVHEVIAAPKVGAAVWPNLLICLVLGAFMGGVFGATGTLVAEIRDGSFRNAGEIHDALGLSVLTHVPSLSGKKELVTAPNVSPLVVAFHRPRSRDAETFRRLRTSLLSHHESMKVIGITSPNIGDGKSIVTANLATSIAQTGRRVLLVDCNLRRPRVQSIFGVENDVGLTDVLAGKVDPPDAIRATRTDKLSVLPCGPVPSNPSELLMSSAFGQLLDWARERYDHVLLDCPPVLAVSDPCIVAPRADAVALVVRPTKTARSQALRAKEMLLDVGAKIVGTVVNAWGLPRRGYGYRSRYQYRDGYLDGKEKGLADSYYESDAQPTSVA